MKLRPSARRGVFALGGLVLAAACAAPAVANVGGIAPQTGTTTVNATVNTVATFTVNPTTGSLGSLTPGNASTATIGGTLSVKTNDRSGYSLSVFRTPDANGDIPLMLAVSPPSDGTHITSNPALAAATQIPTTSGSPLAIGSRDNLTPGNGDPAVAGDSWATTLSVKNPVPFVGDGANQQVVTYTLTLL
jgi:hypothetical protein